MPTMNGGKLAKALKQVAPDLPIVILSSMGETDKSYQEQVNYWLYKPVKKDLLSGILSQVFHNLSTAKEADLALSTVAKRPSLRILLVEDNNVNQKVALRMLERFGYQADTAMNGREAVTAVRIRPYDVVFMDVQMPVMDGLEATRQIRAMNGTVAQPWIVAMTADVLDDAINTCLEAGMNDFIGKPATINMLANALNAVPETKTDTTPQTSAKQNLRFAP
jgi:CheY-like chemotaxis protein